jgi:uncharacterized protein
MSILEIFDHPHLQLEHLELKMVYPETKEYIIYHQVKAGIDCPDGIHAAAIMALKYPNAQVIGDVYKDADEYGDRPFGLPEFKCGDTVVIVDFSYPYSWLKYWEDKGIRLRILDHHAQKFGMIGQFSGAVLDANECGATLAWREVFPGSPMPEILDHVLNRDIGANGYYEGTNPDSEMIAEGLSKLRHEAEDPIAFLQEILFHWDAIEVCKAAGKAAVEEKYRVATAAVERMSWRSIAGFYVPFVELRPEEDRYVSAIGTLLANEAPQVFSWVVLSDGSSSLRSKGFDVSKIAADHGGGGHPKAAGFKRSIK